jgi:hypothetical protein
MKRNPEKTRAFAKEDKFSATENRFILDVRITCRYDVAVTISSAGDTAMAKLEELMTPSELVDAIRDGAAKDELVKKYRASEQELAMMLLPLYRRGEFSKEEFNNFFKGIPVKREDENLPTDAPDDGSAPQIEYEPPSEIVKSLSQAAAQSETGGDTLPDFDSAAVSDEESIVPESAGTTNVLDVILAKVTSIDIRLSEIEKKLSSR